jgi:hypothetical protein
MPAGLSELLNTIDALTREAELECPKDMRRTLALIESRGVAITQLAGLIKDSGCVTTAEFKRLKDIECGGADLFGSVRKRREELREELCGGGLHRSFAVCITGVLNLRPFPRNFAL